MDCDHNKTRTTTLPHDCATSPTGGDLADLVRRCSHLVPLHESGRGSGRDAKPSRAPQVSKISALTLQQFFELHDGYQVNFGKRDDPHPPSKKQRVPPKTLRQDMDAAPTADV